MAASRASPPLRQSIPWARGLIRGVRDRLSLFYHVAVVILSAAIASTLPFAFAAIAQRLLVSWSVIEDEKLFLISAEVAVTLLLILVFGHARTSWRNRSLSRMARVAGMVHFSSRSGTWSRRAARKSKERQAFMRDIMIIGSTGFRTLVDPKGDLHTAIQHCRTAKVMLLDPKSPGALERARTIPGSDITQDSLRSQVEQTLTFLRALRAANKRVQLKLYAKPPLWKLAILGDYAWVQHYHPGVDVQTLPEYVFVHGQNPASLYTAFYQYFVTRWNDPAIPECDLLYAPGAAGSAAR